LAAPYDSSARDRRPSLGFLEQCRLPHLVPGAASAGRALLAARAVNRRQRRARRVPVLDVPAAARGRVGARAPPSGLLSEARPQKKAPPLIVSGRAPGDVEAFVVRFPAELGPGYLGHIRARRTVVQPALQRRERATASFRDQFY